MNDTETTIADLISEDVADYCRCEPGRKRSTGDCPIHVACDEMCGALEDPQTESELRATLDHWVEHCWQAGCSHGS